MISQLLILRIGIEQEIHILHIWFGFQLRKQIFYIIRCCFHKNIVDPR